MGLKILHSADWHLDSPFAGFTEQQRQFLKEEQKLIRSDYTYIACVRAFVLCTHTTKALGRLHFFFFMF